MDFTEREIRDIVSWLTDEAAEMTPDKEYLIEERGYDFSETLKRLRSVVESWIPAKSDPIEVMTICDGYQPLRDANKLLKIEGLQLRFRRTKTCEGDQRMLRLEKLK